MVLQERVVSKGHEPDDEKDDECRAYGQPLRPEARGSGSNGGHVKDSQVRHRCQGWSCDAMVMGKTPDLSPRGGAGSVGIPNARARDRQDQSQTALDTR